MRGDDELTPLRCLAKQVRKTWKDVRVQTQFRFLDTDEWWRGRVAENRKQAEIAEGAIGQPRGGIVMLPSCRNIWTVPPSMITSYSSMPS